MGQTKQDTPHMDDDVLRLNFQHVETLGGAEVFAALFQLSNGEIFLSMIRHDEH